MPCTPPVTTPDNEPTVATPGVALVHVPLAASLNDIEDPEHTVVLPLIAAGGAFTVMVKVGEGAQPVE